MTHRQALQDFPGQVLLHKNNKFAYIIIVAENDVPVHDCMIIFSQNIPFCSKQRKFLSWQQLIQQPGCISGVKSWRFDF
jgi:hypothetical protein